jgi:EAL domain-containing protein (putative c-di-GMP-specific phosphodiesterase class I)
MRVKLIAEGVETPAQLEYLREARCEEAQGYLFSKPVNPMELAALLGAGRLPGPRPAPQRTAPCTATS